MFSSLAEKYAPKEFSEVIGQDTVVKSLVALLNQPDCPKVFFFTGNSGVGKSTLSSLIAKKVGCTDANILVYDATISSGVEDLRNFLDSLRYPSATVNPLKFVIIEEFHGLSKTAVQALLLILQKPPDHVFFVLSTTELQKIPETIKTRCHLFHLKDVNISELSSLVKRVGMLEEIPVIKEIPESVNLIAKVAMGSPRQALTYLSMCRGCTTLEEVQRVLETVETDNTLTELVKLIAFKSSDNWIKICRIFKDLKDSDKVVNPESLRIQIVNYLQACVLNSKTSNESLDFLLKLSNFLKPLNAQTGLAELLVNISGCVL